MGLGFTACHANENQTSATKVRYLKRPKSMIEVEPDVPVGLVWTRIKPMIPPDGTSVSTSMDVTLCRSALLEHRVVKLLPAVEIVQMHRVFRCRSIIG